MAGSLPYIVAIAISWLVIAHNVGLLLRRGPPDSGPQPPPPPNKHEAANRTLSDRSEKMVVATRVSHARATTSSPTTAPDVVSTGGSSISTTTSSTAWTGDDSWFCPAARFPHTGPSGWSERRRKLEDRAVRDSPAARHPQWYCDKMHSNVDPWVAPRSGAPTDADFALGIFSGESLIFSRATAVRDTWIGRGRLKSRIFTSSKQPVHGSHGFDGDSRPQRSFDGHAHEGIMHDPGGKERLMSKDREYASVQYTQLFGLAELYRLYPRKKWYWIGGCDVYLNMDYIYRVLEPYANPMFEPYWVAYNRYPIKKLKPAIKVAPWNATWWPKYKGAGFTWSSGGTGWFLSNPVAKAFSDNIDAFVRVHGKRVLNSICLCPDKLTGILLSLLGFDIDELPRYWARAFNPYPADSAAGHVRTYRSREYAVYHYVAPRQMYAVDQRALHEKLDRMLNANMHEEIAAWFKTLRREHARAVRHRHDDLRALCPGADIPPQTLAAIAAQLPDMGGPPPATWTRANTVRGPGAAPTGADGGWDAVASPYPEIRRFIDLHFAALRVLQSLVRDLAAGVLGRKFSAKDIPPSRALRLKCAPPPEGAGDGAPFVLRVDDGPRTDAPGAAAAKRSVVAEKDRRPGGKYAFFFDEKDRWPEFHFPAAKKA